MMSAFGLSWLLFVLALAGWAASVPAVPALLNSFLGVSLSPNTRRRRVWLIGLMPWLLPVTVVAAACLMASAKAAGWTHDHCVLHGTLHPHLCFTHLPSITLTGAHWLGTAFALLLAGVAFARLVAKEVSSVQQLNALRRLAQGRRRILTLDDARPFAFAGGLGQSFVMMSHGLLQNLTHRERRIVLAHEFAHLRRGDPARNLLFEILLLLHTPWASRRLRQAWRQALEERADDHTVARFGTEEVAALLLKITRLKHLREVAPLSVTGADPLHRVRRLLTKPPVRERSWLFEAGYGLAVCAVATAVFVNHHSLETLLGLLLRV